MITIQCIIYLYNYASDYCIHDTLKHFCIMNVLIGSTSMSVACNDLARMTIMVVLVHPIVLSFTLAYCGICIV